MFAFSQIEPETTGRVTQMPTPVTTYLSNAFGQGQYDSAYHSIMRMREYSLEDGDDGTNVISADEANKKYGIQNELKFDQPTRESVAMLMNERRKAEMDREFISRSGDTGWLGNKVPGIAASFLGGIANPLDFGALFLPIVGEEKIPASLIGKAAWRQRLSQGLITKEGFQATFPRFPGFTSSVFQGVTYQAGFEVPRMLESLQTGDKYDMNDFMRNVIAGGVLAGALHIGVAGASRLLRSLAPQTQEALLKQKINDFLQDKETDTSRYVNVDENIIRQKVAAEQDSLLKLAEKGVDMDDVKNAIHEKYGEFPSKAALRISDGTILTGDAHFLIPIPEDVTYSHELTPGQKAVMHNEGERYISDEGFVTDKGRFVSRDEAAQLVGRKKELLSEDLTGDHSALTPEEQSAYHAVIERGGSPAEALTEVRKNRATEAKANFFARPEIQELVDRERQARVQQFLDENKVDPKTRFDDLHRQEVERQVAAGKMLKPGEVQKNTPSGDHAKDQHAVDEHIKSLQAELLSSPESKDVVKSSVVDDAIKKLDKVIKDLEKPPGMMMDPFLINTLGRPVLRGAFIVVREMLRAGRSIAEGVDMAMEYIRTKRQPEKLPPMPTGHTEVTIQRPDGSTYRAAQKGYWEDLPGRPPVISRVKEGSWSTASLYPGEKIVEMKPGKQDFQKIQDRKELPAVYEHDIFGENPEDVNDFVQMVKRHGGTAHLLAEKGPGGGNPAYITVFKNPEDGQKFLQEYGGEHSPIKTTAPVNNPGTMQLTPDQMLVYATGDSSAWGEYGQNKQDLLKSIIKEYGIMKDWNVSKEELQNRLLDMITNSREIQVREALMKSLHPGEKVIPTPKEGTSRRSFLKTIGKIAAATQLPLKLAGSAIKEIPMVRMMGVGYEGISHYVGAPEALAKLKEILKTFKGTPTTHSPLEFGDDAQHVLFNERDLTMDSDTHSEEFMAAHPHSKEASATWMGQQVDEYLKERGIETKLTDKQIRRLGHELGERMNGGGPGSRNDDADPRLYDIFVHNTFKNERSKFFTVDVPADIAGKAEEGFSVEDLARLKVVKEQPILQAMQEHIMHAPEDVLNAVHEVISNIKRVGFQELASKVKEGIQKLEDAKDPDMKIREALMKEILPEGQAEVPHDLLPIHEEQVQSKIAELEQSIPHPEAIDSALDCILKRIA